MSKSRLKDEKKNEGRFADRHTRRKKYIFVMLWVSHFAHTKKSYLQILLTQLITYLPYTFLMIVNMSRSGGVTSFFPTYIFIIILFYFEDLLFAGWFEVFGSSHATPCTLDSLVCKVCDKLAKEINMIILFSSFHLIVKHIDTWQQITKWEIEIEFSFYHHYLKILPYQSFVISKSCLTVYTICKKNISRND